MKKITDLFAAKKTTFSFELFPPKTEKGYENLLATIKLLCGLEPDFISCTYGAGGGNRAKTLDIVEHIQKAYHVPGVAHLTCVLHTKTDIKNILTDIKSRGIRNVLALRGDPPQEFPDWKPGPDNFSYSYQLCAFIREHFNGHFAVGVAGFPEGHPLCPSPELDAKYLKMKIDKGADYVITQLFFNNQDYYDYVNRLRALGVESRIIPGILPITNYQGLIRFCAACQSKIPDSIKNIFEPIQDDPDKTVQEGIAFAVKQCRDLLKNGAPGLHFYSLNKIHPVDEILRQLRDH